jgi:hypothetical protein
MKQSVESPRKSRHHRTGWGEERSSAGDGRQSDMIDQRLKKLEFGSDEEIKSRLIGKDNGTSARHEGEM